MSEAEFADSDVHLHLPAQLTPRPPLEALPGIAAPADTIFDLLAL